MEKQFIINSWSIPTMSNISEINTKHEDFVLTEMEDYMQNNS